MRTRNARPRWNVAGMHYVKCMKNNLKPTSGELTIIRLHLYRLLRLLTLLAIREFLRNFAMGHT